MSATIIEAIDDVELLGHALPEPASWEAWRTVLRVLFGLPLSDADFARFHEHTGRTATRPGGYNEAWLICGRRSGKSFTMSLIATYLACFRDWEPILAPGELATVMVLASDRRQATVILRYIKGLLSGSPMLAATVVNETQESVELQGRVSIEVHTCSFRSVRGRTVVAALLDEVAFWKDEASANPDTEVLAAVAPSMANVPGAMLLCASTPYARKGALWEAYEKHYGKDDAEPLVWKAPTRAMNPKVPQSIIDAALARDEAANRAEYLVEFRSDVEAFVRLDVVQGCVGTYVQRAPAGVPYFAFVDPSGGSSDSFTMAIAHREKLNEIHVDAVFEKRAPFQPSPVVDEFADMLKHYGVRMVTGDKYAGEWPREAFRRHSIEYRIAPKSKSELYQALRHC
jgi:hypothetical protein